jgi:hypothetical protein
MQPHTKVYQADLKDSVCAPPEYVSRLTIMLGSMLGLILMLVLWFGQEDKMANPKLMAIPILSVISLNVLGRILTVRPPGWLLRTGIANHGARAGKDRIWFCVRSALKQAEEECKEEAPGQAIDEERMNDLTAKYITTYLDKHVLQPLTILEKWVKKNLTNIAIPYPVFVLGVAALANQTGALAHTSPKDVGSIMGMALGLSTYVYLKQWWKTFSIGFLNLENRHALALVYMENKDRPVYMSKRYAKYMAASLKLIKKHPHVAISLASCLPDHGRYKDNKAFLHNKFHCYTGRKNPDYMDEQIIQKYKEDNPTVEKLIKAITQENLLI